MALHEILADRRAEIIQRWETQVRGTLASEAMPVLELVNNHIPKFESAFAPFVRLDDRRRGFGLGLGESV